MGDLLADRFDVQELTHEPESLLGTLAVSAVYLT